MLLRFADATAASSRSMFQPGKKNSRTAPCPSWRIEENQASTSAVLMFSPGSLQSSLQVNELKPRNHHGWPPRRIWLPATVMPGIGPSCT